MINSENRPNRSPRVEGFVPGLHNLDDAAKANLAKALAEEGVEAYSSAETLRAIIEEIETARGIIKQ